MAIQFKPRIVDSESSTAPESTEEEILSAARAEHVMRALAQRVDTEAMGMVPSLAKEMAKNGWQAELDAFRLGQATRLGTVSVQTVARAMAQNLDNARKLVQKYPELEPDIVQMLQEMNDLMKQLPRVGFVGYTARYYQKGAARQER